MTLNLRDSYYHRTDGERQAPFPWKKAPFTGLGQKVMVDSEKRHPCYVSQGSGSYPSGKKSGQGGIPDRLEQGKLLKHRDPSNRIIQERDG